MNRPDKNASCLYHTRLYAAITIFFVFAVCMSALGQTDIAVDIKSGGSGYIPGANAKDINLLLTNSGSKTIVVDSVDLRVHDYSPYNIYTFPSIPLLPPERIELSVVINKHQREYRLYDIAHSDKVISIKNNHATVFDVLIIVQDKGIYKVTIEISWHYLDDPNSKIKYVSNKYEVKFPEVKQWIDLASSAEHVFVFLKNPDSMKTFMMDMGLFKEDAIQEKFGSPAIKIDYSDNISSFVYITKSGGRYVPIYGRDANFSPHQEIKIILATGCGVNTEDINYAKSKFYLSKKNNPKVSSKMVDCHSGQWTKRNQAIAVEGKALKKLIIHDYGMAWAHEADPDTSHIYNILFQE
jgi:hypothetical protein